MIEFVYQTLTRFGYYHPLHPVLTHLPMGMIMGAFLFALVSRLFGSDRLLRTAWHCLVLALIALVPTALLGLMDWQHFYGGALLLPIKVKMGLAGLLLIFLVIGVVWGRVRENSSNLVLVPYLICLLIIIGLGYFGGELAYGTKAADQNVSGPMATEGAALFQQNCSACHFADRKDTKVGPGLKGIFKQAAFPVSGRAVSEENFKEQLLTPFDKMPPFANLSDAQIVALAAYLKTR